MHTALNLIKAPLKKCQTGILKYSACILKERNQNGYLLVEWQAGAQQYEQKNTWGPQIEAIFYQEVIREGTATVLVVRCCFASLRQLIAHVCRTGHQICKMPAQHERSFGEMLSKRAH